MTTQNETDEFVWFGEEAYQALNLEPRLGTEEGESGTVFELTIPGER